MERRRGRMTNTLYRNKIVELVKESTNNGATLERSCKIVGIDPKTFHQWKNCKIDRRTIANRESPANRLRIEEELEIIRIINLPKYANLPPSQIIPKLADEGIYIASESTFYRVMKAHKQLKHRRTSKTPVKRTLTTYEAKEPNQVWTWDITWLKSHTKGLYYKLYLLLDIWDRSIVGHEVWETETSENASILIQKTMVAQKVCRRPLVLHSDNGSPMKGSTFIATLERLGITKSYSRPRVSNDNPYSESLFKTLKYNLKFPKKGFETIEQAREWIYQFVLWYNNEHMHSGINFVTPQVRRAGGDKEILNRRKIVYEKAKKKNPERWSKTVRKWEYVESVYLNPQRTTKK